MTVYVVSSETKTLIVDFVCSLCDSLWCLFESAIGTALYGTAQNNVQKTVWPTTQNMNKRVTLHVRSARVNSNSDNGGAQ
eukprot:scaffold612427_cov102-Attheya_sp.AAC.1